MTPAKITPELRVQIDENLKLVYDKALDLDLPDRFSDLLIQLRKTETAK